MHLLKKRQKSQLLHGLQLLDQRMTLSEEDKRYLYNLEKGLEGEEIFDAYVKKYLYGEVIILNDLLLTVKGSTIQLDTLIITTEGVRIYEVKNYKGNYQMLSGRLLTLSGQEISSPLSQVNRSLIKLRQLFIEWEMNETVEGIVAFVEPSFYLYNADPADLFVFPSQIALHFATIHKNMTRLSKSQHFLAEKLIEANQTEAFYEKKLPVHDYQTLKKGLTCLSCGSFDLTLSQRSCQCNDCFIKVSVDETLMNNIGDLRVLFPEKKLTTSLVYDWCDRAVVFKKIRRILQKNFTVKGKATGTYYD
ncbi:MAG: nuclease-related domain-containing protein [Alkalibacterium sp.]|uniref:nuclease-related domain-containing protein n=1 Tax=Alkalibacterium sp. TaxID=1872447 RepID=UPI003970ED89